MREPIMLDHIVPLPTPTNGRESDLDAALAEMRTTVGEAVTNITNRCTVPLLRAVEWEKILARSK